MARIGRGARDGPAAGGCNRAKWRKRLKRAGYGSEAQSHGVPTTWRGAAAATDGRDPAVSVHRWAGSAASVSLRADLLALRVHGPGTLRRIPRHLASGKTTGALPAVRRLGLRPGSVRCAILRSDVCPC